jgi:hypothetical protein
MTQTTFPPFSNSIPKNYLLEPTHLVRDMHLTRKTGCRPKIAAFFWQVQSEHPQMERQAVGGVWYPEMQSIRWENKSATTS